MKNMNVKQLDGQQVEYLKRIGLSDDTVELYDLLLMKEKLTAQNAATFTGHFPSAHYRLFYALEKQNLVRKLPGRPITYKPLPLEEGLPASLQQTEKKLKQLIKQSATKGGDVRIILGRQELYNAYAEVAAKAKYDIWIYSIGIAFSDSLEQTQRTAINRGVSIHHIIQQKKLSNRLVISKWLRAGVRLKYLNKPRGFHFFLIDEQTVCVTFSDPEDTENRFSIMTKNPAAIEIFVNYFQEIWREAKKIPI